MYGNLETITRILCEQCGEQIEPLDGICIEGNLVVITDKGIGGGVYGGTKWLEKIGNGEVIEPNEFPRTALHIRCLVIALSNAGLTSYQVTKIRRAKKDD